MSSKTVQPIRRREQGETKSRRLPDRNGRKERVRKAVCRPRILIII